MFHIIYVYIFLFSFFLSLGFVFLGRKLALRLDIVDRPSEQRKIHNRPIPLLGGVGMFAAFALTILINILFFFIMSGNKFISETIKLNITDIKYYLSRIMLILGSSLCLVIIGLVDDLKKLPAKLKLVFQILIAIIVFFGGIRITLFIPNVYISALITICWIIGITNAFNLLDNMDGLSCGTAFISTMIFFIVSATTGQFFVSSLLVCFLGILLGFLLFNFPPAKIFMGDAGSLFIGYVLSLLTIINTYYTKSTPTAAPVIMPLLILAVPIFDTFSVMYIRIKNKISIFTADKNHFSHRLVALGMSSKEAVLFIYLVNLCIGLGALLLPALNITGCFIIVLQTIFILLIIVLLEKIKKCSD